MENEECLVEDISSSSDKEMWEIVKRNRPHLVRDDRNEEELVELDGPPPKKPATAEAVAATLNKGFKRQKKGRDRKANTPAEVTPQKKTP